MATELATAYVTLIPSFRGGQAAIQKELGPAADKAGTQTGASSGKKFVGSFGREAKNVGKSIAIGAGLAVAGAAVFKFAKNATTGYKNIGKEVLLLQRYTGASAEEASKLRFVFQQTGIDANAGARGIAIFSKKIVASKDSVKDFGIETRDSSGQLLPMTVLLGKAADKTAHMSNQTDKLAYAQKLFGKGGVEYLKILDKGKQGIDDLAAGAEKYGLILTGKNLAAIKEATANERAQTAAYQGLQVQVGQYLLPVFTRWTGFVATEIPKATAFLHDNAGSVKVIGAAVGGTIALFGAYKAAQIGSTVATGAWSAVTGVAAAAQWVYNEALYAGVAASYALEGAALAATVGVGAIAAGVGVVGAIYKQAADKTARVAAETDNLTEAYRKEVAGQKLAVSQSLIHMLTLDRLGKRYVQLGGSTEGYAQVVQAIPDKIRRLGTSYQDLTLTQHGFDKALKLSGIAGTEWEGILRGMYATLGAADFRDWIGGQAGVAAALETAKSSTNEATSATKAHTSAADRDKKAVQESNAAYKAWRAAVDAAYKKFQDFTNYKIGTTNASIAYAQALADETQAFKDNGYSIDTTTQKGRDNKTAMIASRQAILQQAEALNVGKDGAKIAAKYIIDHTAAL
jgi:hypothetical protein